MKWERRLRARPRRMFRRPRQIDITATVLPAYSDTHEGSLAKKESIGLGHGHCNVFENSCTWRTYYAASKFRPSNESTARRSRPQKERPTLVAPATQLSCCVIFSNSRGTRLTFISVVGNKYLYLFPLRCWCVLVKSEVLECLSFATTLDNFLPSFYLCW